MLPFSLFCLTLVGPTVAEKVRGVPPSRLALYGVGEDGLFRCLDGSKSIPFERVNDDYCDCPDGSDEPGTSACSNGSFFCQNAGHIPAYIPSSRVNDGVCEEDCCDGSDEWLGLTKCPNVCKAKAKAYAKEEAEREAVRASGWKVKEGWMKQGQQKRMDIQNEISRMEAPLQALKTNLVDRESAIEQLQRESHGQTRSEEGQNEVEISILKYKGALTVLKDQAAEQTRRIKEFESILTDLSQGYNPNFQDMAVKSAVTSFADLKALAEPGITTEALQELLEATIEYQRIPTIPTDSSGLWKLWKDFRMKLINIGLLQRDSFDPADLVESKQIINAKASAEKLREEIVQNERDLHDLKSSLSQDFGEHDVLRAVKGQCFSALISDYTYEICLLENMHQRSSTLNTLVGNFDRVDENGSLVYHHGQKCWNGPERSGRVDIECGKTNELIAVREAQKCEYVFRVKSPLGCTAPKGKSQFKDEL